MGERVSVLGGWLCIVVGVGGGERYKSSEELLALNSGVAMHRCSYAQAYQGTCSGKKK